METNNKKKINYDNLEKAVNLDSEELTNVVGGSAPQCPDDQGDKDPDPQDGGESNVMVGPGHKPGQKR